MRVDLVLQFGQRTQPAAAGHSGEQWIQGARTQSIAVALQFLEHPLPVHTPVFRVVQDVDLPESKQELALGIYDLAQFTPHL